MQFAQVQITLLDYQSAPGKRPYGIAPRVFGRVLSAFQTLFAIAIVFMVIFHVVRVVMIEHWTVPTVESRRIRVVFGSWHVGTRLAARRKELYGTQHTAVARKIGLGETDSTSGGRLSTTIDERWTRVVKASSAHAGPDGILFDAVRSERTYDIVSRTALR